ncbi:hypothetical protein, unlikely [Trypanosoma brucei gambiense DAL972]|uniref:Uncharacterized protein n=1 Tax=Trypanosoma brucei gambiense (strain MHOM/CI/86/DAL972) TaxID=679716 RepID=D0A129_TRYB9|nr:hypothetical protein, unlikely [Trypanosoma brucei gambiense DAL972]CBH14971.1 hypothetical protein, unlikely [Trypanosoma brucei gambiense DAL972]|eukprot:XP_011777237.1 hypothetical protein, unlikely [Trypanosoma brucei gambiense DAL972]
MRSRMSFVVHFSAIFYQFQEIHCPIYVETSIFYYYYYYYADDSVGWGTVVATVIVLTTGTFHTLFFFVCLIVCSFVSGVGEVRTYNTKRKQEAVGNREGRPKEKKGGCSHVVSRRKCSMGKHDIIVY